MGSKIVVFCDLCTQEAEEDNLYSLVFKKPGKKTGNRYELCSGCAGKLQVQLVGENELSSGWGLGSGSPQGTAAVPTPPVEESAAARRARLAKQTDDDDRFVAERQQQADAIKSTASKGPEVVGGKTPDGKCLHYNKTSATMGVVDGKQGFVRKCKDCREVLPVITAEERHAIATNKDGD
jgi:hypothetical protein